MNQQKDPVEALKVQVHDLRMEELGTHSPLFRIEYMPFRVAAVGPTIPKTLERLKSVIRFHIDTEIEFPDNIIRRKIGRSEKLKTDNGDTVQ